MKMKITCLIAGFLLVFSFSRAQANDGDSLKAGVVNVVYKDPRIDMLGKKMGEFNTSLTNKAGVKMGRGYRLMVLSTTDRTQALSVRSRLLQRYPDQKVYITFQSPYIKLKFGNYPDKSEAEKYRKILSAANYVENNIYVVNEMIEIKVEKLELEEEEN